MLCLPLDSIRGWLFGTHAARVNPDVRERLIPYQHECYQVLAEAFQDSRLTTDTDIDIEVLLQQDSPAAQAYPMAVVRMARQQLVMEAELDAIVSKLTDHDEQLTDHTSRSISWSRPLGGSMSPRCRQPRLARRNEFWAVYGERYRRFCVATYERSLNRSSKKSGVFK